MLFSQLNDVDPLKVQSELAALGPWQQRVRLTDTIFSPGNWQSWDVAKVLQAEFPEQWWADKRVLDMGANSGGVSLELARLGARVHAAEPWDAFRAQILWWKRHLRVPDDALAVSQHTLFECHELGAFDVVLCLGLVYHFRHPQLVLDYLGNLSSKHFIVSTQTYKSELDVLVNKSSINPDILLKQGRILAGWHPSRALFGKMLSWAGLKNVREIRHPLVGHDWGDRTQTTTNSAYFAADFGLPLDLESSSRCFI